MKALNWLALLALVAAGCARVQPVGIPDTVPELRPGILQGYLEPDALPDSVRLVPPPPSQGSVAEARDEAASVAALARHGTARWDLAAADAVLAFPEAAGTFSCALGARITEQAAPNLYRLLRRSLTDLGLSTYAAKSRYDRPRPFEVNGEPICTPEEETALRGNGSYPSGHSAIGWGWGLILAELAPERSDALLARGRAFAESRMYCNLHWWSDVAEGQRMGSAAVARLHGDPVFRAQLELARGEMAALLDNGPAPGRDCAAESAALGGGKD